MNYSWIIPGDGTAHARDVQESDRRELTANGYISYSLEWHQADASAARTAMLWAQKPLTATQLFAAANELFGQRGSGTLQLRDANGKLVEAPK